MRHYTVTLYKTALTLYDLHLGYIF